MQTAAEFSRRCANMPAALQDGQRRGVSAAALVITTSIRQQIAQATGGSSRLSGVGARGAKIGARYTVRGTANPTALIVAFGPIQLIERDTGAHEIRPRRRRRRKEGGRRPAVAYGDVVRARVRHPGTRGKHPFERGWKAAHEDGVQAFDDEIGKAVRRGLGMKVSSR